MINKRKCLTKTAHSRPVFTCQLVLHAGDQSCFEPEPLARDHIRPPLFVSKFWQPQKKICQRWRIQSHKPEELRRWYKTKLKLPKLTPNFGFNEGYKSVRYQSSFDTSPVLISKGRRVIVVTLSRVLKGSEVDFLVKGVFSSISTCLGNICPL